MNDTYIGRCHCGGIGYQYQTRIRPADWVVRSCQCSFCRAHGARTTTDPQGVARFEIAQSEALVRYHFGLHTADFLLCRNCGVYLAAVMSSSQGRFATLNTNCLESAVLGVADPAPVTYDAETADARNRRREQRWTPVAGEV